MVLARDVLSGVVRLRKGHALEAHDIVRLSVGAQDLHLIELEPDDIHELDAGARLAAAAAGQGIKAHDPAAGHWPLVASRRGMLSVRVDALRRVNALDGICIYTLYDGQIVDCGETVARAKIAPLVIDGKPVEEAVRLARQVGGLVTVTPFTRRRIAAIAQETLGVDAARRFRAALDEKFAWLGSTLIDATVVAPDELAIAGELTNQLEAGAEVLVLAGSKVMDPLDPLWGALDRAGIRLERVGAPAHPGSLFWIAWHGEVPVLGVPSCGLFAHASVFDLVLPRVLTGERVGRAELADLGHGGFLTRELAFRFPAYRGGIARGYVDEDDVG
jgi:hypothetical protein